MSYSEEHSGSEDGDFRPAFDLSELSLDILKRINAMKNLQLLIIDTK